MDCKGVGEYKEVQTWQKRQANPDFVNSLCDRQGEVDHEHRQGGFQEHATCDMSQVNKFGEIILAKT